MSLVDPPVDNDPPAFGPVTTMDWGEDAAAGGSFKIQMEEGKTFDDHYYRDADGHLQFQPEYQQQIDNSRIDWWGVARDLAIIVFGAVGGAGESVLTATGVVGTSGAAAAQNLDSYRKKKKNGED